MLRTVENKTEISNLSLFVRKKWEFSKNFNFFVILAYELHYKILILEKFGDFFFQFFLVLQSKFDQKNQKFITKSNFLWLKTLQFQLLCFSGIL